MRFILFIAFLIVGLAVAGLVLSSIYGPPNQPQTIYNPYVKAEAPQD